MSTLKKNFIYNLSYQLIVLLAPIIIMPHISRVLGPENIGVYSYTHSIAHYFVLFGMLGLHNYGSRTISRSKNNKESLSNAFLSIYGTQVITSVVSVTFYILYILLINSSNLNVYFWIHLIYVLTSFFDINWFFFGIEKFKYAATRSIFVKVTNVVLIIFFVRDNSDLYLFMIIMCFSLLVNNILLWTLLKKYITFNIKPTLEDVKQHFIPNIILFVPVLAISLYNIMDKVMLGSLSTMVNLGYYENTSKVIGIPFGVVAALGTVMLPRMSNLHLEGNVKETKRYLETSMAFIIFVSSGMAFGIAGVAEVFAPVFFGDNFSAVGPLIILMSPIIIIKAWANVVRTQILIPRMRDKEYIFSVVFGALSNIIINAMLIIPFGVVGAIVGTLVAESVVAIFQTYSIRDDFFISKTILNNSYFLLIGFFMFAIVRSIGRLLIPSVGTLLIQIILGFLFYVIICSHKLNKANKIDIRYELSKLIIKSRQKIKDN